LKEEEETGTKREEERREEGGETMAGQWRLTYRSRSVYLQVVINVPKGWMVPGFVCLSGQLYLTNWI